MMLSFLLSSCATRPSPTATDKLLFPNGVYEQNLDIEIIRADKTKSYSGLTVLKKEKGHSTLVAMAGFGITLFKAMYKDGQIEIESFLPEDSQERIKIFAAAILDFHNAPAYVTKNNYLSRWTTLSIHETDAQKRPVKGQIKSTYFTVDFSIQGFDAKGIPTSFRFTHEKMRSLTIIKKYQLQLDQNL